MRRIMTLRGLPSLSALCAAMLTLLPVAGLANVPCRGTSSCLSRDPRRAAKKSCRVFTPQQTGRYEHWYFQPMLVFTPRPTWRAGW